MDPDQLKTLFDQQAPHYDQQWARLGALREALHLLMASVFAPLPADARILCVGAGTGAEILDLAMRFPGWTFTAVEPAPAMLQVCRQRAEQAGIGARLSVHEGYLDTLPQAAPFHAATCLLVSQFILDPPARIGFFRSIAQRLVPDGLLVNADLSADVDAPDYPGLLELWMRVLSGAELSAEGLARMRVAYQRDVAVLPAAQVEALLVAGGFAAPTAFHQAGMIRAWYARRMTDGGQS